MNSSNFLKRITFTIHSLHLSILRPKGQRKAKWENSRIVQARSGKRTRLCKQNWTGFADARLKCPWKTRQFKRQPLKALIEDTHSEVLSKLRELFKTIACASISTRRYRCIRFLFFSYLYFKRGHLYIPYFALTQFVRCLPCAREDMPLMLVAFTIQIRLRK